MRGVLGGAAPQVAVLSEAISTALNTPDESEGGERADDEVKDAETTDDDDEEESSAKADDDAQTEVMIGLANDIKAAGPAPAPPAPPAPARRSASSARPRRNTTKTPARQRA